MNGPSSSPFSPHNDVLNASPSTTPEKLTLIEELKRRGRISVISKRYPDAKALYTKAIDVLTSEQNELQKDVTNEIAILYSNRALCNLQMNHPKESHDDALNATCHDDSYVKGFWRLGQASMALKHTEEALIAYEKALALDGTNKALKKECDKAKKQLELDIQRQKKEQEEEEARKAQQKEEEANGGKAKPTSTPKTEIKPKATTTTTTKSTTTSTSTSTTEKKEISKNNGEFSKSDHVRGYKVVNGKKTSFFHHEQTEEEKRLIGDITPQRIDPSSTSTTTTTTSNTTTNATTNTTTNPTTGPTRIDNNTNDNNKNTSAWNKAGTWEEKDVTEWAITTIQNKLSNCTYNLPNGSPDPNAHVKVTKISKLLSTKVAGGTCHASVATVRSKKKYIFEIENITIHWSMTLGNGTVCQGQMTFLDVDGTHVIGEGYDVADYSVKDDTPPDVKYLLERFVRDGGFRNVIEGAIDEWIGLFRETY